MDGVTDKTSGDLLRAGTVYQAGPPAKGTQWDSRSDFDAGNETLRTDVPNPPKCKNNPRPGQTHFHRATGPNPEDWIEVVLP